MKKKSVNTRARDTRQVTPKRAPKRYLRLAWRLAWRGALGFVGVSVALVLLFSVVPPPGSMIMLERKVQSIFRGEPITITREWRRFDELSSNAKLAVIAAEDQRFPQHRGFDLVELRRAWQASQDGARLRGASTLSQQTAKNVFLWSGRSWLRKGLEAWFTLLIETFWSKSRILEVYLNVAEWDTGVFGLEAAADHYFGASGSAMTERQASLLAAILPDPRNRSASRPDAQVERRSQWIRQQMRNLGGVGYLERL